MSRISELVSRLAEQLGSHESRLDALATNVAAFEDLAARVAALEARLAKVTSPADGEPVPIRDEPTIALAEYRRQLEDVAFEPEADSVTSAMRAEHLAAVDAARGEACFRHTLGGKKVTVQGTVGGSMIFLPECDCTDTCIDYSHRSLDYYAWRRTGDFREDLTLPVGPRVLLMAMKPESVWSVTVLEDQRRPAVAR